MLAGKRSAVLRALNLIEELGPHIGLVINFFKCEVFSPQGNHLFPLAVKSSLLPNLEILGVPIGDYLHCSHFIAENCSKAKVLFTALVEVAETDLHVAVYLLRICGSYCKLVHLARTTPPSLSCESLKFFDEEVRRCFSTCIAADNPDDHWKQHNLASALEDLAFVLYLTTHVLPSSHLCLLQVLVVPVIAICWALFRSSMLLCSLQRPSQWSLFCPLLSPSMPCARSWMIIFFSLS